MSTSAATGVSGSAATLNGEVAEGIAPITATGFRWGLQSNLSDATDLAGDVTTGSFAADLSGLTEGQTVYYTAYATNAVGTSFGDTLQFTSIDCNPTEFQGHTYNVVVIGSQCWFAENLQTHTYANGDAIDANLSNAEWAVAPAGAQVVYNNYSP